MSEIKMTTDPSKLDDLIKKAAEILYNRIVYNLSYLGETCVRKIRDRSGDESWFDQTANLRSSIGYAIYSYGQKIIESAFRTINGGSEGSSQGRKMVDELSSQYSDTYALVVVAAMEYAEHVEALENKDVLASTYLYAKRVVAKHLQKAIKEAENDIQKIEISL